MKIAFCCIVFNGNYVLRQMIDSIYPFANQIIFVDGVVDYWAKQGFTGSIDDTIKIIESYPDIENKIILHKNIVAKEKTELCQKFMESVDPKTNYIWCIDSDEMYKDEAIIKTINLLESQKPESISFQSVTFFGGFEHILTGFERNYPVKRILRYEPGCYYKEHRPPTLSCENKGGLHIPNTQMTALGIEMYHYSYVFPKQVKDKVGYYKKCISLHNCIDNYFENIWLLWVLNPDKRQDIENEYLGVHEFIPSYRGECRTVLFDGEHPEAIQLTLVLLKKKFKKQLNDYR
jgi:hypothetical protein